MRQTSRSVTSKILAWIMTGMCLVCLTVNAPILAQGGDPAKMVPTYDAAVPTPTLSEIRYGPHERQVMDFWQAKSESPTPLAFVIHGGAWRGGEKERLHRFVDVQPLLDAGISVVAINYRLMRHVEGVMPPVKVPLEDAARALQFVRTQAKAWNIDKARIGAAGGSAGACTSLWLAYHDDLADPEAVDPVARESTRLWCAAVMGPQTTLDPKQMKAWTPNSRYGGHAFGKADFAQFLAERDSILHWIAEYSPYALVSHDDPSVYLSFNAPPAIGQAQKDPTHTANFGVKLKERCEAVGIGCDVQYPGAEGIKHETPTDYLIWRLKRAEQAVRNTGPVNRPNVLFIAIDDLRPELGCYGADHIKSPNIDRLASQGVLFNRAYCQAPHCGPSRASLLTGVHTRHHGLVMSPEEIAPDAVTLPGAFRQAGYRTVGNGKIFHHHLQSAEQSWSEPPFSLVNGPKENNHLTFHDGQSAAFILEKNGRGPFYESPDVPDNTYIDGQTCDKAINDLRRLAKMDSPFFLACGFVRPHLPFYAPKKYWDLYHRDAIEIAPNRFRPQDAPKSLRGSGEFGSYHDRDIQYNSLAFHRIARHGYYACVSYADALVGRLLAELDRLSLTDHTIVVLWGDHGWHLGEHNFWSKHNLLHNSTHAPLIISAPGFEKNVKTDGIVELIDIYPTLCELTAIELPGHLEGQSMVPLLRNPKRQGKTAAFTKWRNGLAVTTGDYTYTEYGSKERMLFDRRIDPEENENVAEVPEYQATVRQLSRLLTKGKNR